MIVMSKICSAKGNIGPIAMILPVNVPSAVGVPEITPVVVLSVTPGGRKSVAAYWIGGAPVAINVCEYGTFRKPAGGNPL